MSYNGSGNTIPLISVRPRNGKHPKQLRSNAKNLFVYHLHRPIVKMYRKPLLKIRLINCQIVCNKRDEIVDIVEKWISMFLL